MTWGIKTHHHLQGDFHKVPWNRKLESQEVHRLLFRLVYKLYLTILRGRVRRSGCDSNMPSLSGSKGENIVVELNVQWTRSLHSLDLYIRKLQYESNNWRRKEPVPVGGNCHQTCRAHMKWINKSRQSNLMAHIAFWANLETRNESLN